MSKGLEVKILTTKELGRRLSLRCTASALTMIGAFDLNGKVRCHTQPVEKIDHKVESSPAEGVTSCVSKDCASEGLDMA